VIGFLDAAADLPNTARTSLNALFYFPYEDFVSQAPNAKTKTNIRHSFFLIAISNFDLTPTTTKVGKKVSSCHY
jgi:hypothetical protein